MPVWCNWSCVFFRYKVDQNYTAGLARAGIPAVRTHRGHPDEVNVTALTYAFANNANADHRWTGIDDKQDSIFNVG